MPRSIVIAEVRRGGGSLRVRFPNKQGRDFTSAQQVQDIVADFRDRCSEEVLVALAIQKVGAASAESLAGKTITAIFDVDIA